MSLLERRSWWFQCVMVCVLVASVCAAQQAQSDEDEQVTQMQVLLKEQQRRVDFLQQQLVANTDYDQDDVRVETLRRQIREVLGEQDFREGLMPAMLQAGYDKGFFIRSSDDKFLLKFHGRTQFRWTHYANQSRNHYRRPRLERDDQTGFNAKRLRFHIMGHAFDPDLTYFVKLWADSGIDYDVRLLYAWINYRFKDEFQIKMGMFQAAATRAGFQSSANMQFVEYPETVLLFDPFECVGVRFWGQLFDKHFEYFFDVVNSFNGRYNRTITPDGARELDNNPGIAFRAVWHACGDVPTRDFVSWADVDHKEMPCLDFGFHYLFNEDDGDLRTSRIIFKRDSIMPGGFGVTTTNGTQIHQVGLDAAFKWQGFSASGEYICRFIDVRRAGRTPFTPVWLLTGDGATTTEQGAYLQMGYFLPIPGLEKKLEAVARVGGITTNVGRGGSEGTWIYTAGLNYYFEGNKVKLQTDVTKIPQVPLAANSWLANANDNALIWRVQLQVAF